MTGDAILLIGDMINDLVHPDGPTPYRAELARAETVARTKKVIGMARAAGVKIAFVRIGFSDKYRECPPRSKLFARARRTGIMKLGTWGTEVHAELAPEPGDIDIIKHRVSPFHGTNLEPVLRAQGIRRLFVLGVSTGGVVMSAAKDGHDRDYDVTVIEDCCCAASEEEHRVLIANIGRYATITTSMEVDFERHDQDGIMGLEKKN